MRRESVVDVEVKAIFHSQNICQFLVIVTYRCHLAHLYSAGNVAKWNVSGTAKNEQRKHVREGRPISGTLVEQRRMSSGTAIHVGKCDVEMANLTICLVWQNANAR